MYLFAGYDIFLAIAMFDQRIPTKSGKLGPKCFFISKNRILGLQILKKNKAENVTQPTFICSKSTIEVLEKDVKHVQSYNKSTRTISMTLFYCNLEHILHLFLQFLLLTWNK